MTQHPEQPNRHRPEIENLERIKDLILTAEEYKETPFAAGRGKRTYVYEVENGEKKIVYFGAWHTNDPEDQLFDEIKAKFDEIQPDIVFIEGWWSINGRKDQVREALSKRNIEDIKTEGEPSFVLKLAVDAGIDFESPEPITPDEIIYLVEQGFSKRDIFFFYVYRDISQYQRQNENGTNEGCAEYLKPFIKNIRSSSGWSEEELDSFEKEVLAELDVNDHEKYHRQVDPIPWDDAPQTKINEITKASGVCRDRYMVERVVEAMKTHNKLFVVFGTAHAVMQEPAVREVMKTSK